MAKGASLSVAEMLECREALVNTGELEAVTAVAARRVLEIQAKLHRWARDDPHRRFDDLFNLVADPAFLLVAWNRSGAIRARRLPGWTEGMLKDTATYSAGFYSAGFDLVSG